MLWSNKKFSSGVNCQAKLLNGSLRVRCRRRITILATAIFRVLLRGNAPCRLVLKHKSAPFAGVGYTRCV